MLLLAVDTSGRNGSLALVRFANPSLPKRREGWGAQDFEIPELIPLAGRMYSAQIIPALQSALSRRNLQTTDIDAYAVASGPGSFTGLRVGLSTVKALSEVLHRPIAAVSVLEAAARMTGLNGKVTVALDAGRQQVFVGEYDFDGDFKATGAQESLVTVDAFLQSMSANAKVFSPDQLVRESAMVRGVSIGEIATPQADIFARIGYQKIIAGETTPAEILEANYIRASDAELFSLPKLMPK
jgi:tRNA threonylcarbamoyladenosine biosynthesis protein TsaB